LSIINKNKSIPLVIIYLLEQIVLALLAAALERSPLYCKVFEGNIQGYHTKMGLNICIFSLIVGGYLVIINQITISGIIPKIDHHPLKADLVHNGIPLVVGLHPSFLIQIGKLMLGYATSNSYKLTISIHLEH
jgi:hypothetical protein